MPAVAWMKELRSCEAAFSVSGTISLNSTLPAIVKSVTIDGTGRDRKPVHRLSRFTDVFVWRDGRWQIVAGHSSRIPEAAK